MSASRSVGAATAREGVQRQPGEEGQRGRQARLATRTLWEVITDDADALITAATVGVGRGAAPKTPFG